jgi:hypothetical protein
MESNSLSQEFPRLFSFALDQNISLRDMVNLDNIEEHFYLPLSAQAFDEFTQVGEIVLSQELNPEGKDVWKTQWKDGVYTASKYYHYMFRDQHASPILARIWKSKCILRIKFFAWLLINDRLNTRDMLRRRQCNVTNVYDCVLCPTYAVEDWMHLFFYCNFSQRVWNYLQISWGIGPTMESILFQARRDFEKPFFFEIVILACWHIWKQRNGAIFERVIPSFRAWRAAFISDVTRHMHRVKDSWKPELSSWIDNLM